MKLYDISQEVFSCSVYPGDPCPERKTLSSMDKGQPYNLTAFSMCAHNGTHVDAPRHFIAYGMGVDKIPLERTVGEAYLASHNGVMTVADAAKILEQAAEGEGAKRILIKGDSVISTDAAKAFADGGVWLLGVESQSVGDADAPMEPHLALLYKDVVLLEGLRLSHVPEGRYLLFAAPLSLKDCDGAPCRAVLAEM